MTVLRMILCRNSVLSYKVWIFQTKHRQLFGIFPLVQQSPSNIREISNQSLCLPPQEMIIVLLWFHQVLDSDLLRNIC